MYAIIYEYNIFKYIDIYNNRPIRRLSIRLLVFFLKIVLVLLEFLSFNQTFEINIKLVPCRNVSTDQYMCLCLGSSGRFRVIASRALPTFEFRNVEQMMMTNFAIEERGIKVDKKLHKAAKRAMSLAWNWLTRKNKHTNKSFI